MLCFSFLGAGGGGNVMSENVQDCVLLDAVMLCTASDRLWCL